MAASNDPLEARMLKLAGIALNETAPVEVENSSPAAADNESTAPLTESELERFSLARAGIFSNEK